MKSVQHIITSGTVVIPLNERGGPVGVGATPAGAGNYTIEFTLTPQNENLTNNTFPITDMTAATTAQQTQLGPASALIVTLNSGTSVTVDITQSDV